jgi:hypothetical protein
MSENEMAELDDGSVGELLVQGPAPLTPKEEMFCRAYADPESATYGQATKSAEVAQYQEPHNAAWKLRRRPRIIARIAEYEKLTRACVGKVLTDLEHERQLALAKGDIAAAIRASELQGKHLAMFTDRMAVDDSATVERYDARRAEEASRIVAILLTNPQTPMLERRRPASTQEQPRLVTAAEIAALESGRNPQAPQTRQESE